MNGDLIDVIKAKYPSVSSLEMESFYLINANKGNTHTTASAIGLIQRGKYYCLTQIYYF